MPIISRRQIDELRVALSAAMAGVADPTAARRVGALLDKVESSGEHAATSSHRKVCVWCGEGTTRFVFVSPDGDWEQVSFGGGLERLGLGERQNYLWAPAGNGQAGYNRNDNDRCVVALHERCQIAHLWSFVKGCR